MPLVIVGCCLESDVWAYGLKPQILEVRSRGPGGGGVLSGVTGGSVLSWGWGAGPCSQHCPSFLLHVPSTAFLCFVELSFTSCPLYIISLNLPFKL